MRYPPPDPSDYASEVAATKVIERLLRSRTGEVTVNDRDEARNSPTVGKIRRLIARAVGDNGGSVPNLLLVTRQRLCHERGKPAKALQRFVRCSQEHR